MKIHLNAIYQKPLIWIIVAVFALNSCSKNEIEYENAAGILKCKFQLSDGRVFDCVVDQSKQTIENSKDSLLFGTTSDVLSDIKLILTTTVGAEVLIDGVSVVSSETSVDLTKMQDVEVVYKDATRHYQMKLFVEQADHSETLGAKINTDMRMTGLPSFNWYTSAWFKGQLYILGAHYPGGTLASATAYYELYSSPDGISWTKVDTNPRVIGGFGAKLIVYNDKLYVIGGGRNYGTDIDGNKPETSVTWRIMSSSDGVSWTDCTTGQTNNPSGRAFAQVCVHDGKLLVRRGKMLGFGMWQNIGQSTIYQTTDGITWTVITPTNNYATNRSDDAMFSFDGKLWTMGGYGSFISASQIRPDIHSSVDNGLTWIKETPVSPTPVDFYGHQVVTDGVKLYMFGGERLVDGERVGVQEVYSSDNGFDWYPLEYQLPPSYKARIYPSVTLSEDGSAWVLGGFTKSAGSYCVSGLTMESHYDVWAKKLK